ncbi:MAG: BT_3987 domain-containing protein [Bacteroides sp.]
MKNKRWFLVVLCTTLFISMACNDNKDEFLEDYRTILSIKESGEVPLTLYKIAGEDGEYRVVVNKGGSVLNAVTSIQAEVMDKSALDIYNVENSTEYVILPANTYELGQTDLAFASSDLYQQIKVRFKTEQIYALPKIEGEYVLPIRLAQSTDSINNEKKLVIVKPTIVVPSIYLAKNGYVYNAFTDQQDQMTFKLPIKMPFTNKWDFDCSIGIDESLLNDYNAASGIDYALLPSSSYTLSSKVSFTAMDDEKDISFEVKREGLSYGNYILPIYLSGCSKSDFVIDEAKKSCLYGISYVPDMSKLSKVALTENMLSSNSHAAEGSIAAMLDGDVNTYFHSDYSGSVAPPHYLQVALGTQATALSFSFTARSSQGNGTPAEIDVLGSMDGVTFHKMAIITEELPPAGAAGAGKSYASPVVVGKAFKYLRLVFPKNQSGGVYFVFSEFSLKTL